MTEHYSSNDMRGALTTTIQILLYVLFPCPSTSNSLLGIHSLFLLDWRVDMLVKVLDGVNQEITCFSNDVSCSHLEICDSKRYLPTTAAVAKHAAAI